MAASPGALAWVGQSLDRVGGMIVSPRGTLGGACQGRGGGLPDLVLLLLLQFVAVHLRPIVKTVWFTVQVSYTAGLSMLLNTLAQSVIYPVAGVFLGTVVASVAARARATPGSAVDVVALCAVPTVCLDLALTLGSAATGFRPSEATVIGATALGGLWFVVLLAVGIRLLREDRPGGRDPAPGQRAGWAPRGVGLGVVAILFALFLQNAIWLGRHSGQIRPLAPGATAPEIDLPRYGGGRERLSDHRGQVVLLDFWASWCGPCVQQMPRIAKLERRLADRGLRVLSINTEGSPRKVERTPGARELRVLLDVDRVAARRYGVQTLPHLVVVGRDGKVIHVQTGAMFFERVVEAITRGTGSNLSGG